MNTAFVLSGCLAWACIAFALLTLLAARVKIEELEIRIRRLQTGNALLCDQVAWDARELATYRAIVERRVFGRPPAWRDHRGYVVSVETERN